MANTFTGCSGGNTGIANNSSTRFWNLGDSAISYNATEAQQQVKGRTAGVASHMRCIVKSNGRITNCTVTFRNNGGNGNQTFVIGSGATGTFEDASNTDTLVDGQFYNMQIVTSTGGGTLLIQYADVRIAPTSGSAKQLASGGANGTSTASQTSFMPVAGITTSSTTEANVNMVAPVNMTLSNLQIVISTNARTTNTVFSTRINGGDGTQSVTVGSTATGFFEDTSNSDSVTAGQAYNLKRITSTGTGTINCTVASLKCVTNGAGFPIALCGNDSPTATAYYAALGNGTSSATEADYTYPVPFKINVTNLATNVPTNVSATTSTIKVRNNGVDGNNVTSYAGAATGLVRDTTHTDTINAAETLDFVVSGMTVGAITIRSISAFVTEVTAAAVKTWDGLAWASVKTVDGLANASIKTVNGLASQ